MLNPKDQNKASRLDLIPNMHRHHRFVFYYGLFLVTLAMIAPSLAGLATKQVFLPEQNEAFSHPTFIIYFISLLLISAMFFTLTGATFYRFWFRFLISIIVGILLLVLGWSVLTINLILPQVLFLIGFILWRGPQPITGDSTIKDMLIITFTLLSIWGITFAFGLRLSDMEMIVTAYIAIAQIIAITSFLPMPLLFISGLDLAHLTNQITERMTLFFHQKGNQVVLLTLLATSIVKVGFNLWKFEWNSISSLVLSGIFLLIFFGLAIYTPKTMLEFNPQFKHWIVLTVLILPLPLSVMVILIMFGIQLPIHSATTILTGAIGPICLLIACSLFFFKKRRPFSIMIALIGIWTMLTSSLTSLGKLVNGLTVEGLTLWSLDGVTAFIFILWGIWLLYQKKESPFASTALKFSFFLSCCLILDQLLNNQVAVAELYTVFQLLTFLVIRQFIIRPKLVWWIQALPWILVVILFAHNIWGEIFPEPVMNSIKIGILTIAMLWDIFTSEEKIRGTKIIRSHQPGLLFIYLGVVTWTIAQVVFAKSGKGATAIEWEPVLLFGFLTIGIPWVLYSFLKVIKMQYS